MRVYLQCCCCSAPICNPRCPISTSVYFSAMQLTYRIVSLNTAIPVNRCCTEETTFHIHQRSTRVSNGRVDGQIDVLQGKLWNMNVPWSSFTRYQVTTHPLRCKMCRDRFPRTKVSRLSSLAASALLPPFFGWFKPMVTAKAHTAVCTRGRWIWSKILPFTALGGLLIPDQILQAL